MGGAPGATREPGQAERGTGMGTNPKERFAAEALPTVLAAAKEYGELLLLSAPSQETPNARAKQAREARRILRAVATLEG